MRASLEAPMKWITLCLVASFAFASTEYQVKTERFSSKPILIIEGKGIPEAKINDFLAENIPKVKKFALESGAKLYSQAPFARMTRSQDLFKIEVGFMLKKPSPGKGDIKLSFLPSTLVATTTHTGSLEKINDAYKAITGWMEAERKPPSGSPWEQYLTELGSDQVQTKIYYPVR